MSLLGYRWRAPVEGERVRVYFNLHKSCWSIVAKSGEHRGRVIAYATSLHLENCTFHVSQAGRRRVLAEGRKNVHAYIDGEWCSDSGKFEGVTAVFPISYNPFKADHFHTSGLPLGSADAAFFDNDRKVYGLGEFSPDTGKIEELFRAKDFAA